LGPDYGCFIPLKRFNNPFVTKFGIGFSGIWITMAQSLFRPPLRYETPRPAGWPRISK
jgi:hypothetical protein